jgi:outer membrane protein OmpA-like peptidoglycan-associated protein
MLSWIAVHVERDRIEHDLEQRAGQALLAAGYDWATVVFSGRDGLLVGTPARDDDPPKALALVRGIWGVRSVEGRVRPAAVARLIGPAGPRSKTSPKDRTVLPPLGSTIALLDGKEADLADVRPIPLAPSKRPVSLIEPRPEAVPAWEEGGPKQSYAGADAQMPQGDRQSAALETATLPAANADSDCGSAVAALSSAEPVGFGRGEIVLDAHGRSVLDRLALLARDCPGLGLTVVGHADARGPAPRNLALSQRRADAVVAYLIDKGIDAGRLKAIGYGEARPLAPNDTAQNRAKNRRIEVEIMGVSPSP